MLTEIVFDYEPIPDSGGKGVRPEDYQNYIQKSSVPNLLDALVIEPFQESLKKEKEKTHTFGDITIRVGTHTSDSTSWKEILAEFTSYLAIRADDSRAKNIEGVGYQEGIGYCILASDLHQKITTLITENTSGSSSLQCDWPRQKKNATPLRALHIPIRNPEQYTLLNLENAHIVLNARHFKSTLEKEVIKAFKDENKKWHENVTGYNEKNIPPVEESPIRRFYTAGPHLITVNLVTVPKPQYKAIVTQTNEAFQRILEGVSPGEYGLRHTFDKKNNPVLNIKNVADFLAKQTKEHTLTEVRYDIAP